MSVRKGHVVVVDGAAVVECDEIFDSLIEGKLTLLHTQWIRQRVMSYDTQPIVLLLRAIRAALTDLESLSPVSQAAFSRAEVVITQAMLCANDVDALSAYLDATFPVEEKPVKVSQAFIRRLASTISRNLGVDSVVSIIEIYGSSKPHDSLILHWIHELTFRTQNMEEFFNITKFVGEMKAKENPSPLSSIPLNVHPMESSIRLPVEDANSIVYYLPYGPIGFPPKFRPSRSSTPITSTKVQRLINGTKDISNKWMRTVVTESLNQLRDPRIEFRVLENSAKDVLFDADCLVTSYLGRIGLESLIGVTDSTLQVRKLDPNQATQILFSLVSFGTRGDSEHQLSYGRYLLRRILCVLTGSTSDIMNQVDTFKWYYLEADSAWFHKSYCDNCLVAIRKDGRLMTYIAVSEPTAPQSTLISFKATTQIQGPLHQPELDGLSGKSVIRIVDNEFIRKAPLI
eukprot:TRINITY_DN6847_c1_g1_i1.p1 TRINITY_DN6847_c1_g1~~TRINITY_DN6847_c1_g1_i1.p1  ORF type:complete len:457 (-),score=99.20 TRINITY_DN6847_c1_g1_i1:375-1745(-)